MRNCKKRAAAFALAAILCCSLAAPFGSAATNPSVVIDGKSVQFSESMGAPFVDSNNRTQVPLRAAMEAMGAKVDWDGDVRTAVVSKGSVTVRVPIGAEFVWINGEKKTNDTAALIKDSRTYLPIRIVAEALGADVGWDGNTKTVKITTHGNPVAWVLTGESWTDTWSGNAWVPGEEYSGSCEYVYDGTRKATVVDGVIQEIEECEYNSHGQVKRNTTVVDYGLGELVQSTFDYKYNYYGLKTYEKCIEKSLETTEVISEWEIWYEYNSKGDITKELYHNLGFDSWKQSDYVYAYDANGRISQMTVNNPPNQGRWNGGDPDQLIHKYKYNSHGQVTEEDVTTIFKTEFSATYHDNIYYGYDEYGNIVRQTTNSSEEGSSSSYEEKFFYSKV